MKRINFNWQLFLLLFIVSLISIAVGLQQEWTGATIKARAGTVVTFDSSSRIQDEDGTWTNSWDQMRKLSQIQSGVLSNGNFVLATNVFARPFLVTPHIALAAGTNAQEFLVSASTTNFVAGAIATNQAMHWIGVP